MRTDFRHRADLFCKRLRHDTGFQGTQADSPYPLYLMKLLKQRKQFTTPSVRPVGTDMNSRQYNLLISFRRDSLYFPDNLLLSPAPDPSSGIRYDAVRTELVTAVLNLDVSASILRRLF